MDNYEQPMRRQLRPTETEDVASSGQIAETLILRRFSLTEHVLRFIKTTQDLHVLIQMPVTCKSQLIGCFTPAVLEKVFEA